jgi:hypothetical protein
MKEITSITPNGIHYADEAGNPQFLDFETCYQNFLRAEQKRIGARFTDEVRAVYEKNKNVGIRFDNGNPPSIAFYTVPPTTFKFPTLDSIWDVVYRVKKAGWRIPEAE